MLDKFNNTSDPGSCLSEAQMLNYLAGKLSPAEQHRVEVHLLDCAFCSDALEGMEQQPLQQLRQSLNALDQRIDEQIEKGAGRSLLRPWFYRIAAILIMVALSVGGIYYLQKLKKSEKIFVENFEPFHDTSQIALPLIPLPAEIEVVIKKTTAPSASEKVRQKMSSKEVISGKSVADAVKLVKEEIKKNSNEIVRENFSNTSSQAAKKSLESPPAVTSSITADPVANEKQTVTIHATGQQPSMSKTNEEVEHAIVVEKNAAARKEVVAQTSPPSSPVSGNVASLTAGNLVPEGIKQYEAKNYSEAINFFNDALKNDRSNPEALFYNGVSYLSNNQNKEAINMLETVVKNSPNKYSDAAKWYLSLGYIKEHKLTKAKILLKELSENKNDYQDKAIKTLEELK